jgi:predicted nucleic acid-binding protein
MKIIVDSNIVFSALLNSKSNIGDLILNLRFNLDFYAPHFLLKEIDKHNKKILAISKLPEDAILEIKFRLFKRIQLVDETIIPKKIWIQADKLVNNIDDNDLNFVALAIYMKGHLWTGDKALYEGLRKKKFRNILSTKEMDSLKL